MADNYFEKQYEAYQARKAAWEKERKSRKYFLQYAKDNGLTMAGMHLPAPAFK